MSASTTMPTISEAVFQRRVVDKARDLGWGVTLSARKAMLVQVAAYHVEAPPLDGLIFHPRYSLGSEPGWPDLTLIRRRDRRLIFAELKSDTGVLSVRQTEVLELLRCLENGMPVVFGADLHPTIQVFVWRPGDMDEIARVLR